MAFNTPNIFLKIIPITITGTDVTNGYKILSYTDRIEAIHEDTVKVYFDGQLIPRNTSSPTSKFYYELVTVIDGKWPGAGPGVPVTPDASTATFTLKRNAAYIGPGYGSTGGTASFATNVMTLVTAPANGGLAVGQAVTATGVTGTITALASGNLNEVGSTYTLSSTPGTLTTRSISTGNTTPTTNTLSTYDAFVISYYYTVYMV
ncbi:MAG: hypothetical protein JHC33_12235 [Ignisphaera sp.]|nr:hypothetical protein [Ignisphaera sp.]